MAKFYKRKILVIALCLLLPVIGLCTHIVGGSLTYEVGAANSYTVTLKLYRDCCGTCAAAPGSATVNIRTADGTAFSTATVVLNQISFSPVTATLPPCATAPASPPCAEEYIYRATVTLVPPPGGLHLYYQLGNRNSTITNIINPGSAGETFYAYIPSYQSFWVEDFTLANGTTTDAGPTAWSFTQGPIPTTTAVVNNGQFEVSGDTSNIWLENFTLADGTTSDAGSTAWTSTVTAVSASVTANQFSVTATGGAGSMTLNTQAITISSYTAGVTLRVDIADIGGNLDGSDNITVAYSLNGGAPVNFPGGSINGNFANQTLISPLLTGNTVQIIATVTYGGTSPTNEVYVIDNITVVAGASMHWASQVITISSYTAGVNLSVNLSEAGTLEANDNITVSYSLNGGAPVNFPTNGSLSNDFTTAFARATGLTGTTIQVFISVRYDGDSPSSEIYRWDMVSVYDNIFRSNSSPSFGSLPPLYLCAVNSFTVNYAATDSDGDSLAYSMYTPYNNTPNPPTFTDNVFGVNLVTWQPGYSATSPFNSGGPGVTLGATTGQMTGVANSLGQYVFGIKCSEYRAGVLLSEVVRDYQANVVTCPPFVPTTPTVSTTNPNPICTGQTLSLTASSPDAGVTYSWTGPNSFSSTLQNPTIPNVTTATSGTYSVIAIVTGCNSNAGTFSLTVNTTPTVTTASSNTPVCAGTTLSLNATGTGSTYNWSGPGSYTSTAQNPTVPNVQTTGTGNYSVTTSSAAGCISSSTTTSVTINPAPPGPSPGSNSTICEGNTLSLTANTIASATYSWAGPNGFTSSLEDPAISAATTAAAGTYTVIASVSGCNPTSGTTSVGISPRPLAPTAGSNSPLCIGNTLNLTASSTGTTYSWSGPNSFTSTLQNPNIGSIGTVNAGTYSVTATTNGCTGNTGTVTVTVAPAPPAPGPLSNSPVCAGQILSLTSNTIGSATYSWSGPNSFTSSLEDPTISGVTTAASGTYSVFVTVAGCAGSIQTTSVTINPGPSAPTVGSNSPVCSGQTLSLTCSTVTGAIYSWSGPGGFTSTLEDPTIVSITTAASGTYSVSANVPGCSVVSGSAAVTVNQTPVAPTAGSNSPVCVGSMISLTASSTGTSYVWSGPNSFTSTLQDPTIGSATTAMAGTYSVNAIANGCTGSAGTISVAVNPPPTTIVAASSNSPVCSGNTLSLTAATFASGVYSWSGPNGFTSTSQNPTIPGVGTVGAGTYSVSVTIPGCSSGGTGNTSVTVNQTPAAPSASSNSPVCPGMDISLAANASGSPSYSWSGPNSFTSTLQAPVISPATTASGGTYSVMATENGCTGPAGTISVTITTPPVAPTAGNNGPVCVGNTISLTATTVGGVNYFWAGPNGFSSALQNPTIGVAATTDAGTYSVVAVSIATGCISSVSTTTLIVNPPPSAPTLGNSSPVCSGQTLSLSCSSVIGATYAWSGPNSFTSTLQNPTIINIPTAGSGTYSLIATVAGCPPIATQTISATVNPTPAAPTAGSNSPACIGGDISLTANSTGATYVWSGPNSFTSTAQDPVINSAGTVHAGSYSVTTTSAAGCTSTAGTTSVTVNPPPPTFPVAGSNSPICLGQTISLTCATVPSATYSWLGPNSFTSTTQNPTIAVATVAASGTYSVIATIPGCGSSGTGTVAVTVNPIPAAPGASSNAPICSGSALSLTANTVGSSTYTWTGPAGFSSASQNPVISVATTANSGTYSVTATENGCQGPAGTVSVTVNPIPAAPVAGNNGPLCIGDDLTLTANTVSGATYSWSGPNSFTSTLQNPTILAAATSDAGTYAVSITVNGCSGPAGTTSVIVAPPPSTPTPGSNSPVCSGTTLSLTANSIFGATYSWSGPNSFTSSSEDPTIAAVTTAGAGTYTVFAKIGSCTSPTSTIAVTVDQTPPAPGAGSNSPLCLGSDLSLTATTVSGATYAWSGPNSFSSTLQDPVVLGVSTADAGTYSVSSSANGCTSSSATVTVVINPPPIAPAAGSNSPACTGQTLSLTAGTIASATYSWNGPNSFTSSLQNPTITPVTIAVTGTYSVSATVPGCPTGPVGTVSVSVNQTPAVPSASNSGPVCAGSDLSLTSSTVGSSTYLWTGPTGFTSASQNPVILAATTANSGIYSVSATENGCTSNAGTTSVTIKPIPGAPTAGNNGPLCLGDNLTLTANTISGATYSWNGPNGFVSSSQNPVINNVTTVHTGTYSVSVLVAGCTGAIGTTTVIVAPPPSAPAPGSNSPVCSGTTLSLTANTISGATYVWSGPNSFTSSTQNPAIAGVSTAGGGIYSVFVKIGSCTSPSGTVAVTVNASPAAPSLSSNSPLCVGDNLSLTASTVSGVTYAWNGPNSFSSSLQDPIVNNVSTANAGTYSVSVTNIVNGCITTTSHSVSVTSPAIANAGTDQTVCANNPAVLGGTITGGIGTGIWSTPNGAGIFTPNTITLNASYVASNNDTVAGNILLVLTSTNNGGCAATKDTVVIHVTPGPQVNAGADQSICGNNYSAVSINGSVLIATGGIWSSLGTGTFVLTNTVLTNTYVPTSADTANGSVVLVLTSSGNGSCAPVTDSLLITFTPAPVVNAGADVPVCFGSTTAQLNGTVSGGATTGTWTTLGTGTFTPTTSTLNATYNLSNADTTAGSVKLVLTSTNFGNCLAVTDTVLIYMTASPIVTAGSDITVCANNDTIALNGNVSGGTTTGYWSTSGTGTFLPDSSAQTGTYIPSSADTAAGNITLTLTSTNGCIVVTDALTVTITDAPVVNAGPDVAMCGAATVLLSGSVSSAATGGIWTSSGNGSFVPDNITLNASYVPGSNDTSLVYLVLSSTGNGQCLAVSDSMRILIGKKPIAGFSNSQACTGQLLSFNDTSITVNPFDTIVSWNWTIGGGNFTAQNPSYTYSTTGTDSVTLIVTTNTGCVDTVWHKVNINPSPVAAFTYTVDCTADSVYFTNTSTIPSGNIVSWSWNFGDGNSSTQQNPVHSYTTTGTYLAALTVTSDSGCTFTFVDSVKTCSSVQAGFTSSGSACSGQNISFTDTSLIAGSDSIASWDWTFGDGGTDTVQNPTHTYNTYGTYTVSLIVITNSGATDTAIHTILVNPAPVASFTVLSTCTSDSVYFTNTSTVSSGNIISWNWNFGDGNADTLQNPVHSYSAAGTYTVSLTVASDSGCTSTFIDTLVFAKGLTAGFSDTVDCKLNVFFTDTTLISTGDSLVAWSWNFGDGNFDTLQNPSHTYSASGTYTVQLIATTLGGCSDTVTGIVTVVPLPVADFVPSGGTYFQGEAINFTDLSSGAVSWMWTFGDGNSGNTQNPSHTYGQNGSPNVILIVMNSSGCTDTVSYEFTIYPNTVGVPSAFTPNNDGVNDELHVMGGPMKEMDWRIYNEWGNEVFHATDQSQGWDATYKGKVQPATRYIYILKGTTISGDVIEMNGEVTIVR